VFEECYTRGASEAPSAPRPKGQTSLANGHYPHACNGLRLKIFPISNVADARIVTKSVRLGELTDPDTSNSATRVYAKRREKDLAAFFYIPCPHKVMRSGHLSAGALWFARDHSGCERNPRCYTRSPKVSGQNSQTLRLTGTQELTD
jgi:hypothetical protein